jgi:hypothetical protein
MYLIFQVFAATLAGILISLVASGLLKSVNGADLAFGTFRVDVNTETVPDFDGMLRVKTVHPGPGEAIGLRHSIHSLKAVPKARAKWIVEFAASV